MILYSELTKQESLSALTKVGIPPDEQIQHFFAIELSKCNQIKLVLLFLVHVFKILPSQIMRQFGDVFRLTKGNHSLRYV